MAPEEDSRMLVEQQIEKEGVWKQRWEQPSEGLQNEVNFYLESAHPYWRFTNG